MNEGSLRIQGSGVWGELYGSVYRDLRTKGISHFDAEDLAQDVVETAYVHLDGVDPNRRQAWLSTVTRNKVIDRARRSAKVQTVAEVPEAPDPSLGPDELAIQSADRGVLLAAVALLSERDSRLVRMRYLDERSVSETAEELGMSVGSTKVALYRARERLKRILESTRVEVTRAGEAPGIAAKRGVLMTGIAERAVRALSPYVGPTVADMYVRGTAVSIGKTSDELDNGDSGALEERARRVLSPLLPPDTIERVVAEIRGGAL